MASATQIINQIPNALNQAVGMVTFVVALCGIALTYFGKKVYWIGVFLSGMPVGMLLGGAVAAAAGWGEVGITGGAIAGGMATGMLALAMTKLAVFFIGLLAGGLLAVLLGANEPLVVLCVALVCGVAALFVYDWAIIVGTAFTGAVMLVFVTMNVISFAQLGRPSMLPGNFLTYLFHLGQQAFHAGTVYGATRTALRDLCLLVFFFGSGVAVQLNLHKIFKRNNTPEKNGNRLENSGKRIKNGGRQSKQVPLKASRPEPSGLWQVRVISGGNIIKVQRIGSAPMVIGRGKDADIRVNDEMMSRRHLEIRPYRNNGVKIRDLGSTNGTWKKGKQSIVEDIPEHRDWYQAGQVQVMIQKA